MIENGEESGGICLESAVKDAGLFLHVLLEAWCEEVGVLILFYLVGEHVLGGLIFQEGLGEVALAEGGQALLSLVRVEYSCLPPEQDQELDNLVNLRCLLNLLLVLFIILFWPSRD